MLKLCAYSKSLYATEYEKCVWTILLDFSGDIVHRNCRQYIPVLDNTASSHLRRAHAPQASQVADSQPRLAYISSWFCFGHVVSRSHSVPVTSSGSKLRGEVEPKTTAGWRQGRTASTDYLGRVWYVYYVAKFSRAHQDIYECTSLNSKNVHDTVRILKQVYGVHSSYWSKMV